MKPKHEGLNRVFHMLLPSNTFDEHDALEDALTIAEIYKKIKHNHRLDDANMMNKSQAYHPNEWVAAKHREPTSELIDIILTSMSDTTDSDGDSLKSGWLETIIERELAEPSITSPFCSPRISDIVA